MASRAFPYKGRYLRPGCTYLTGKIVWGAGGTITSSFPSDFWGIASIAKNSTGKYTITLEENYYELLEVQCTCCKATAPDVEPFIWSATPDADVQGSSGGAGSIKLGFISSSGGLKDPVSAILKVTIGLRNHPVD